jgi:hypothetical protein
MKFAQEGEDSPINLLRLEVRVLPGQAPGAMAGVKADHSTVQQVMQKSMHLLKLLETFHNYYIAHIYADIYELQHRVFT